jgi:hypothetical protein
MISQKKSFMNMHSLVAGRVIHGTLNATGTIPMPVFPT